MFSGTFLQTNWKGKIRFRELRNYTQEMDVSGIVWEGATARPVVISALEQMEFNKGSSVLVTIIRKRGIRYFRLANS